MIGIGMDRIIIAPVNNSTNYPETYFVLFEEAHSS
jgi:hypothetical protein